MKTFLKYLFIVLNISAVACPEARKQYIRLWYREPADQWMKSTPVGNGRLGAMIFGGIETDRIALNEITIWSGMPDPDQEVPCGKEKLAERRITRITTINHYRCEFKRKNDMCH